MVELDFRRTICSRDKLAVWFAFWGERRFRPTYRRICAERDRSYDDMVRVICAKLCEEGGYTGRRAALVADGLSALTGRALARPPGAAGFDEPRPRASESPCPTWRTCSRGISASLEAEGRG